MVEQMLSAKYICENEIWKIYQRLDTNIERLGFKIQICHLFPPSIN